MIVLQVTSQLTKVCQKIPLRVLLVVPFVMQMLIAVGLTGWVSWRNGQMMITGLVTTLQEDVTGRIAQRLESYLLLPQLSNQEVVNALDLGLISLDNRGQLQRFLAQKLRYSPSEINKIQLKGNSEEYLGIARCEQDKLCLQINDRATNQINIYHLNSQGQAGKLLTTVSRKALHLDVLDINSNNQAQNVWSSVYSPQDSQKLALSLIKSLNQPQSQSLSVVSTEINLAPLNRFLQELPLSKQGQAFIIERSGKMIANSQQINHSSWNNGQHQLVFGYQNPNLLSLRAIASVTNGSKLAELSHNSESNFSFNQKKYFVKVTPFNNHQGLDWLIFVIIPKSQFNAQIQKNTNDTIILCFLALGIATLIGIITARWTTKPILQLSYAANVLASGKWNPTMPDLYQRQDILFQEAYELTKAFETMKRELQQSFEQQERIKSELAIRVEKRTVELKQINNQLIAEIEQKQKIETALRLSELKFRNLFENSEVGIFRSRYQDGLFLDANEHCAKILGYESPEAIIGQKSAIDYYVDPLVRDDMLQQLCTHREVHNFETQFYKQDGTKIWVLVSGKINAEENCFEGVIADISDRKQAESALSQSEKMYRDLVQTANCVIIRFNPASKITFINDYGAQFFGYNGQELLGESILGKILPDTPQNRRDLRFLFYDLGQKQHRYLNYELEHHCRDGTKVWVSWANKPIFNEFGQLSEILSVGTDTTASKQAEELLRQKEEYLRLILDNIPQQVFWKDTNLVFLGCNKNWAQAAHLPNPEAVIGKTDYDLLPSREIADQFREQDLLLIARDQPILHVIATKQRPGLDGQPIWLDINKIPMHDSTGKVIGILGVLEDITQRKLAEEALHAEREKSEALLLNILPQAIANRLKEDQSAIAEHFEQVTILFADVVGFTPLSAQMSPIELVNFLNEMFSSFDQLAAQYGLEKIKTIGDAYMVVGGLPLPKPDHAQAIADMALAMQQTMLQFQNTFNFDGIVNKNPDCGLQIRIGINTGSVVAGVIGTKKFIYDLWGDAVNVASRMEATGQPGKIQVTSDTYHLLKDQYYFSQRGAIAVKGKGEMMTYWLVGKR